MRRLANFLLCPSLPLWQYVLALAALILIPSYIFIELVSRLGQAFGFSEEQLLGPHAELTPLYVLIAVALAPIIETGLIAVGVALLRDFTSRPLRLALASGLVFGLLHALTLPIRLIGSAWAFFLLTSAFLAWRERSLTHAVIAAAVPHSLVNGVVVLVLAL